ncbi:MAG: hypothetical protein LW875_03010 [Proteobacteria bacterium]|nr:hypothetical protein [Pseudomonadota bacterium]
MDIKLCGTISNMKQTIKLFQICLVVLALINGGCATVYKYESGKKEGTWKTEIFFNDKLKNKSQTVSAVVFADRSWPLRMEVTGTLGVSIASLLIDEFKIHGLLHLKKQSITGENSAQSIRSVIGYELPPEALLSAFFDEPIRDKSWNCRQDPSGKIEECRRLKDKFKITWADREEEKKKITLESDQFEAQIFVKDFQPKVLNRDRVFKLNIPSSYKQYKVSP